MDPKELPKAKEFKALRQAVRQGVDLDAIINEAFEGLKNDPEVYPIIKKLGLTNKEVRKHIGLLRDFQKDYHICADCPGLDDCPKDIPHYKITLEVRDGFLDRRFAPCPKMIALMQANSRYFIRDFPEEWLEKGLASVDLSQDRNPILVEMVSLAAGESKNWLYLTGKMGSGRSYLLACFSNDFSKNSELANAYCDTATLIDSLRGPSFEDKDKFDKQMARIEKCPLLVLDGFGDEYKSDFAFSTILFPILRERAKRGLLTCFSSDFSLAQIEEMYSAKLGRPRAHQLIELIRAKAKKERKLTGLPLYE